MTYNVFGGTLSLTQSINLQTSSTNNSILIYDPDHVKCSRCPLGAIRPLQYVGADRLSNGCKRRCRVGSICVLFDLFDSFDLLSPSSYTSTYHNFICFVRSNKSAAGWHTHIAPLWSTFDSLSGTDFTSLIAAIEVCGRKVSLPFTHQNCTLLSTSLQRVYWILGPYKAHVHFTSSFYKYNPFATHVPPWPTSQRSQLYTSQMPKQPL